MRLLFVQMSIMLTMVVNKCGCSKEEEHNFPKPTYQFSQTFKDYNLFQNGSTWIYQRENSQDKDTVKQEYLSKKILDGENYNYCYCEYEYIFMRHKSSYFKNFVLQEGFTKTNNDTMYRLGYDIINFSYENGTGTSNSTTPFYDAIKYIEIRTSSVEKVTYQAFHPTYAIEGKTYQEVKVFESNFMWSDTRLPRKTYYAKNVGIIRRELWNGQVWNLISHEVKQ
jgi:hypothetical protein